MITNDFALTATQVAYHFICQRKLWLFSNHITMEQNSDLVALGKQLHEDSYQRKRKEIQIGPIKLDFIESKGEVHEVKKSRKMEQAHEWQMLYYLYYLKKQGITAKGFINYPLIRQVKEVVLSEERETRLIEALDCIKEVISQKKPPVPVKITACRRCSYYELCWS